MIRLADLQEKNVLLLGYGKEGDATHKALQEKTSSAKIFVYDDVKKEEGEYWLSKEEVAHRVDASWVVIKTPGIPPHHDVLTAVKEHGAQVTTATNLFFAERKGRGKIIGVTGTKGKTTTASLLAHTLKAAGLPVMLVGNVGVPMLSAIDASGETIFVTELSSYMLADLNIAPDIAVFVSLFNEHMDWHGSVEKYQEDKMRIATLQTADDIFLYNKKFPALQELAQKVSARCIPFALHNNEALDVLNLEGEHNKENACAVLAVAELFNVPGETIKRAFASFAPVPHRLERVGVFQGVTFINDSISTTPESAIAAIDTYKDDLSVIILGGYDRGYDFSSLANRLAGLPGVEVCVMPGGDRLEDALQKAGVTYRSVQTLEEPVKLAYEKGRGVCLLSPASPSYGQFKNFEDRGDQFKAAITRISAE